MREWEVSFPSEAVYTDLVCDAQARSIAVGDIKKGKYFNICFAFLWFTNVLCTLQYATDEVAKAAATTRNR